MVPLYKITNTSADAKAYGESVRALYGDTLDDAYAAVADQAQLANHWRRGFKIVSAVAAIGFAAIACLLIIDSVSKA